MTGPRTFVEQLDAARDGDEFAAALSGLFAALDKARDGEEQQ